MPYKVEFSPRANREFKKLAKKNKKAAENIRDAIKDLGKDPRPNGVEPIQDSNPTLHRIRVGNFRVIYEIRDEKLIVLVLALGDRKAIYRFLTR